ncbi:MAG: hypothetical protein BGO98_23345 [Myxococcales bacterium 68-20]|nr:MAG: hypothetical protein BGO98_23345 [Myxococcales bacterium 68-20]
MIRKRAGQRSFSDAFLFGAHIPDPKTLLDPVLRQLDEVLESDELVDEVLDALRKRHPQSGRRGRPGTPAEVALRLLVLKHLRQWSFEELQWEVTGNVAYRAFCRIDSGKVPDAKTMIRINQAVDEATLRRVFERVVEQAKHRKLTRGRRMRVDTTVVETGVRYPLDSGLCEDVTRVACREMERVRAAGLPVPDTFRNVRRSVARRLYEIEQIGRRPTSREAKLEALKRPYRRLLRVTARVVRQARAVVEASKRLRRTIPGEIVRSLRVLEGIVTNGKQVVAQTRARILRGDTRSEGKLVSIFDASHADHSQGQEAQAQRVVDRCSQEVLRLRAGSALRRSRLLLDRQHRPRCGDGRAPRSDSEARSSKRRRSRKGTRALVPPRTRVARRWRGAHLAAETNLRNGALALSRRSRPREMRLLGGDREQPGGDREGAVSLARAPGRTPASVVGRARHRMPGAGTGTGNRHR